MLWSSFCGPCIQLVLQQTNTKNYKTLLHKFYQIIILSLTGLTFKS